MYGCEKERTWSINSVFKVGCKECNTCYEITYTDSKQMHNIEVVCKCGNTIKG